MPAIAKRPEDRQRRNQPAVLDDFVPGTSVPLPPPGLSLELRESWGRVWTSPIAQLFDPASDLMALRRLFSLYALGERLDGLLADAQPEGAAARAARAAREYDADDPLTLAAAAAEGGAARDAFNAAVGARLRVATEVRMLEAQLGLSPRARVVLGLAVLAGRKAGMVSLDDAAAAADDDF